MTENVKNIRDMAKQKSKKEEEKKKKSRQKQCDTQPQQSVYEYRNIRICEYKTLKLTQCTKQYTVVGRLII